MVSLFDLLASRCSESGRSGVNTMNLLLLFSAGIVCADAHTDRESDAKNARAVISRCLVKVCSAPLADDITKNAFVTQQAFKNTMFS